MGQSAERVSPCAKTGAALSPTTLVRTGQSSSGYNFWALRTPLLSASLATSAALDIPDSLHPTRFLLRESSVSWGGQTRFLELQVVVNGLTRRCGAGVTLSKLGHASQRDRSGMPPHTSVYAFKSKGEWHIRLAQY